VTLVGSGTVMEAGRAPRADEGAAARLWPRTVERAAPLIAVGLGLGFFGVWCWLVLSQYDTFHIYLRDFSIYVNTLWNTAHGSPFATTLLLKNQNHLAEHVAPLLVALAPISALVPDPRLLIVVQQGALALAGAPVYLLARHRIGGTWAPLVVLAAFYLAPNLAQMNVTRGFYPVAVSALAISFGAYFMLTGRTKPGVAVALAALLIEETAALALLGLATMLVLRRELRAGLLVGAVAAAWIAVLAVAVMPSFHLEETLPQTGNRTLHKYRNILEDPIQLPVMIAERGPEAVRWLLMPNAGLPLLAPQTLVASLPTVLALTFQVDDSLKTHRIAPAIPLLWLATVEGLVILRGGWRLRAALALVLGMSVASYVLESPLPGGGLFDAGPTRRDAISSAMDRAVVAVPPDASAAGTSNAMSHLAGRAQMYAFPGKYSEGLWPEHRIHWYVLDVANQQLRRDILADRRSPLREEGQPYGLWLVDDAVLVATDSPPQPALPARLSFGGLIELDSYDARRGPEGLVVRLRWLVSKDPKRDLHSHAELNGSNGRVLAAHEGPASHAYHPTSVWQPGQVVVEEITLPLAASVMLDGAQLRLAWSTANSGDRLPLPDGSASVDLPVHPS
jgi:uncharacterized membrane protein